MSVKPHTAQKLGAVAVFLAACSGTFQLGLAAGEPAKSPSKVIKIVAFGDSLTAGYGLRPRHAFPAVLARALKARGENVLVVNAGVSGDTTGAALARLDWAIPRDADAVIVELGANDALRGLDPLAARSNLDKIVYRLKSRNIEVLIAGMLPPANYGDHYRKIFGSMYADLAKKHDVLYYPFFLEGIALKRHYNLPDGLHPNARGVAKIVTNILPMVLKLIERVKKRRLAKAGN